jgi:DNA-3-methyladenine glycosylase II
VERISFELEPVLPFRLDLTVWTLRRRPDNVIDRWDGKTYRRVLVTDNGEPFAVAVTQSDSSHLCASIICKKPGDEIKRQAISALERLLGIDLSIDSFYCMAERDDRLKPLANQFRGFKPPRFQSYFETLINAISCQQLTLTVGIRLLNSLVESYGPAIKTDDGVFRAFPRPQDLANADIEELRQMSFSYRKARYITGLAQLIARGQLDLNQVEFLDDGKP